MRSAVARVPWPGTNSSVIFLCLRYGWNVYFGSESGTCVHSDRSSLLPPAHQGMKSRSCGLVQRFGTAVSATPHLHPCGGQAPALHFFIPPSTTGLQFGTFRRWRVGMVVDWRAHFRAIPSYELPRTHQGYEEPELSFGTANWHGGFCHAPPRPQRGTSPSPREVFDRATFSHSAIGRRSRIRPVSPVESRHQGRSAGTFSYD